MREKAKVMIIIALVMIIAGLGLTCIDLKKERDNYYAAVLEKTDAYEKLEIRLYAEVDTRLRVQYENEHLWDLYYSQVSDYEGEYEYYE